MPFTVSLVTDEKDMRDVYRLRYKVYCDEWEFENPDKHENGLEMDEFDKHAIHFAVRDDSQKTVGTIRMILNSPEGFPLEKYCEVDDDMDEIPKENIAEISRLAILAEVITECLMTNINKNPDSVQGKPPTVKDATDMNWLRVCIRQFIMRAREES